MKHSILIFLVVAILASCRGPQGPIGPEGPEGPEGSPGEGFVWETEPFNFEAPDYTIIWDFPDGFEVLETDIVLVYMLWAEEEIGEGQWFDVWKPLPASIFAEGGIVQYSFDYTMIDVAIMMEATNPDLFVPALTDNVIARIALIPAYWADAHPEINFKELEYHSLLDKLEQDGIENVVFKDVKGTTLKAAKNRL